MPLTVTTPDIGLYLGQSAEVLNRNRIELHRLCGIYVLNESRKAYIAKSRGQMGSDGIAWKKISRATAEARVRRRAPARRIVEKRKQLAKKIQTELERNKKATKGRQTVKKQVRQEYGGRIVQNLRDQRQRESDKLQGLIDAEHAKAKTGIDTGLQINSAQPGYQAPDGEGGNTFKLSSDQVVVGYGRSYSTYFDEDRKLLPATLPPAWDQGLSKLLTRTVEQLLKEALG